MDHNREDIQLLRNDPGSLVLKYRSMIDTIVQLQINAGFIRQEDKEEFVHFIIDEFLMRVPSICVQYTERSLLRTYCAAIFRNLCRDGVRMKHQIESRHMVLEAEIPVLNYLTPFAELVIRQEVEIFGRALELFGKKANKLRFYLKAYYRLPLFENDIVAYYPKVTPTEMQSWLDEIRGADDEHNKELFEILGRLAIWAEGKRRSAESVRKWIKARIFNLVTLMNKSKSSQHTDETIQILAERFFQTDADRVETSELQLKQKLR